MPVFGIVPWRHHILIVSKCKSMDEAFYYLRRTIDEGLSRSELEDLIADNAYFSQGKALTNFAQRFDEVHYCEEEFQRLWNDAIPVTLEDVNNIVGKTHLAPEEHQPTPYELYMRMLIDHFGNQVEDDFIPQLPDNYREFV